MTIEIITRKDFLEFKYELFTELKAQLSLRQSQNQWIKSSEVKKMLLLSSGTLQTLRLNGTLPFTKVGGVIYYNMQDIDRMMDQAKSTPHSMPSPVRQSKKKPH